MSIELQRTLPAIDTATATAEERALRQRTLKEGVLSYNGGSITTKCLVRDLSAGGAKLRIVNDIPWPNRFHIEIPTEGLSAECEVRWREGLAMGVAFTGEVQFSGNARPQVTAAPAQPRSPLRRA